MSEITHENITELANKKLLEQGVDVADSDIQSYVERFVNGVVSDYNQQLRALNYGFEGDKDLEQVKSDFDKAYSFILSINIKKLVRQVTSIYNSIKSDYQSEVIVEAVTKAIPYKSFGGWDCLSNINKNFVYVWFEDKSISPDDIVKVRHTLFWEVGYLNYVIMIVIPLSKSDKVEILDEIEKNVVENLRKKHKEREEKK